MRALVAIASKHGSTWEIGSALASELRAAGVPADLLEASNIVSLDSYDFVVIGSAVYMGNWMPEAKDMLSRFHDSLARMPVWLFSSGPIGADDPKPKGDPQDIADLALAVDPQGYRVFAGKLDKKALSFRERLVSGFVHAPEGDFRDWEAIREWADEIAAAVPRASSV